MVMTLFAFDLTTDPLYNELLGSCLIKTTEKNHHKNLPEGFCSPMGFWLSTVNAFPTAQGHFEIIISETDLPLSEMNETEVNQTVVFKQGTEDALTLRLSACHAYVVVKKTTWDRAQEAILLVITQYWRFSCIEKQLNQFSMESRKTLRYASKPTVIGLKKAERAVKNDTILRSLMQDMPSFEGPLVVATRYLSTQVAVNVYLELSKKLTMEDWAEQINGHLEAVSTTYEGITEKLFYHKGYLVEIVLEFIIVVILLLDLYFGFEM